MPESASTIVQDQWQAFYSLCWDAGLCLASSVRSPKECGQVAQLDITVETALLEARLLAGNADLFAQMQAQLAVHADASTFFTGKLAEQARRQAKFGYSPYALEPNCKESPGGLRDLHLLYWGMRMAGLCSADTRFWQAAVGAQLLDAQEAQTLAQSWAFIASVRCHLHQLAGREEDRLLFDWQIPLAHALGYTHHETASGTQMYTRSASAAFMRDYYAAIKSGLQMLDMALQRLQAQLEPLAEKPITHIIDENFAVQAGYLDLRQADKANSEHDPQWIWRAFALYQERSDLKGWSANTLRAYYRAQQQIDTGFCTDPHSRRAFLQCLQAPAGITRVLRSMNACGFLALYLPSFALTVGQVQHDLMHAYTVDQHILLVLSEVRRFFLPQFADEVPPCHAIAAQFDRPWIVYVAALFHDIAKGRGGDHSSLGAQDAQDFATGHDLEPADAQLLVFLVREHLTFSQVAQKRDLSDPEVIASFAKRMGDLRHLQALYLLTAADIRGTNPQLWTDWKAQLLHTLYLRSAQWLAGQNLANEAELVAQRQAQASQELARLALPHQAQAALWSGLDAQYFLRFEAAEIAWHTRVLSKWMVQQPYFQHSQQTPAASAAPVAVFARRGAQNVGLQVLVYASDQADLFARICAFFDRSNLSVLDAKIYTTPKAWALDSFLLQTHEMPEHERELLSMIEAELQHDLQTARTLPKPKGGRLSRRMRHFPLAPRVEWLSPLGQTQVELELSCADRLGLLYAVAQVFAQEGVALQSAKIVTLGERVEDRFVVTSPSLALPQTRQRLSEALLEVSKVTKTNTF
jgi:[protein-PII] uridylyltransferase